MKYCQSVHDFFSPIHSNMSVFVHGASATPISLLKSLTLEAARLKNVEIIHLHTEGDAPYAEEKFKESFRVTNLFVGKNLRGKLNYNTIDYLPCFLSEIPQLFRKGIKPLDVAFIQVSSPDSHGYVSLGVSVDVAKAAVESAKIVIAQINSFMPRIHGDGLIHISHIDYAIELNEPIYSPQNKVPSQIELQIGKNVAELVEDGATIQLGIGAISDAVCSNLTGHKNLGLHSEMWSDGALQLIKKGIINNSLKKFHQGKSTSAFILGSPELYQFADDNMSVLNLESSYINYPINIMRNPNMIIFLCVPFAAFGGIFALFARDINLSLSAAVGFIALIGIALLNGIVLLTVFNQLKIAFPEKSLRDLVLEGTLSRFRPVIMTALVASIGFIPMALNTGLGSEVQKPLATVVIGGILFSTLLTLVLFPAVYLHFHSRKRN